MPKWSLHSCLWRQYRSLIFLCSLWFHFERCNKLLFLKLLLVWTTPNKFYWFLLFFFASKIDWPPCLTFFLVIPCVFEQRQSSFAGKTGFRWRGLLIPRLNGSICCVFMCLLHDTDSEVFLVKGGRNVIPKVTRFRPASNPTSERFG